MVDRQKTADSLVYEATLTAKRAEKALEAAQAVRDEALAAYETAACALELMVAAFGAGESKVDADRIRAKVEEEAAI